MKKIDDQLLVEMIQEGKMQFKEMAAYFGVGPSAITNAKKRILSAMNVPESFKSLTEREKRFVLARAEGKTQTQAALASYDCGSMESAKNIGSQLSKKDEIQKAIADLMFEEGLTRRHRIRRLKDHIDNKTDRQSSLKGIDIANKMEGLYVEKHVSVTMDYAEMQRTYAELVERERELMEQLGISGKDMLETGGEEGE